LELEDKILSLVPIIEPPSGYQSDSRELRLKGTSLDSPEKNIAHHKLFGRMIGGYSHLTETESRNRIYYPEIESAIAGVLRQSIYSAMIIGAMDATDQAPQKAIEFLKRGLLLGESKSPEISFAYIILSGLVRQEDPGFKTFLTLLEEWMGKVGRFYIYQRELGRLAASPADAGA
jgi:hypothetical protein